MEFINNMIANIIENLEKQTTLMIKALNVLGITIVCDKIPLADLLIDWTILSSVGRYFLAAGPYISNIKELTILGLSIYTFTVLLKNNKKEKEKTINKIIINHKAQAVDTVDNLDE